MLDVVFTEDSFLIEDRGEEDSIQEGRIREFRKDRYRTFFYLDWRI